MTTNDPQPNPAIKAAANLLMDRAHAASVRAGWWADPQTGESLPLTPERVAQKLMLIVSEDAKAMEDHRKGLQDERPRRSPSADARPTRS